MKNYLLTLVAALTLVLAGCADATNEANQNTNNSAPAQEQQENNLSTSIKLTKEGEEVISEDTFEFEEGESLMDVMDRNFDLTTGFGGDFIVGIDGLGSEDEADYYWNISVNGESLMVGASDYTLEENDEVHFDYQKVE
ncbi:MULTISPECIES: DUF4430 domain-containing protein [unclassified Sutcliffiella]|uniref:DUF4430 domain-containing protein n=1 Tax=unclassified Sutcliffiella TaxID=2837532 RepID=UPI0030CD0272